MPKPLSLEAEIGNVYGRLTVVSVSSNVKYSLVCSCECGNTQTATIYNLKAGRVKSCGCLRNQHKLLSPWRRTHGLSHTHEYKMWTTSKRRAAEAGFDFDLVPEDIIIPDYCPVLGIKLRKGPAHGNGITDDSPSIDRIDNERGYTQDNICVVSMKANRIKANATVQDIEAVLRYMKGEVN